jgi:hypothetical protein
LGSQAWGTKLGSQTIYLEIKMFVFIQRRIFLLLLHFLHLGQFSSRTMSFWTKWHFVKKCRRQSQSWIEPVTPCNTPCEWEVRHHP